MTERTHTRDRLLLGVAAASAALALLSMAASRLAGPERVPARPRGLPRVPAPPASVGDVLRSLGVGSLVWYACLASAPLFVWMARRFPFDRARWPASLGAHVLAVGALAAITALLRYRVVYGGSPFAPPLGAFLVVGTIGGALPFLTVAAAAQAIEARFRAHQRALEAERARSQLAETRLEALMAQLQPHFLFNTLQGISTLITRDPAAADQMLASLSDLLREVLRGRGRREVPLAEELRVLQPYLDISRRRFGQRLAITVAVDDEVGRALVPFFVLQPLVENAIHHGVSSHAGAGLVEISGRRDDGRLLLAVTDDGPGAAAPDAGRGIGLANTRARLQELYGDAHSLEMGRLDGGGFRVCLAIPFRLEAA
ncbi:MAG: sensor histidine kinase [Gemmatimonadaceae bacterium]